MSGRAEDLAALDRWVTAAMKRGAIAVLTHRNGDMDTVGSACALARILGPMARACGLHQSTIARAVVKDTGAEFLQFTDGAVWPRQLGGLIIVDAAGPSQPGVDLPDVPKCIIDHHAAGEAFDLGPEDLSIVWEVCSTAEIIQCFAEAHAADRLDDASRQLLLAGIVTDTGRFRHADAHALACASRLSDGASLDFAAFVERMESVELNHSQRVAIAKALSRVETLAAGKWFLSYTRASTNEGIVARSLISAGADVALVARRAEGETRLSARASRAATKGGVHLGELMQAMVDRSGGEGGGHAGAAGWTGKIDAVDATSGFIALLMASQGDLA
jgi:nanoRNase/pAp phosphatase (c-di-AMP/oligoRNAs hydrolase)